MDELLHIICGRVMSFCKYGCEAGGDVNVKNYAQPYRMCHSLRSMRIIDQGICVHLVSFSNSRINTRPDMSVSDILTGRAQRNLDLLIDCISELPSEVRNAMKLCLTAASGQMTKMVFAVTGRGKTSGRRSSKVEVGSWVIGYWRPKLHFEVNVWNCFERRVSKLSNAVKVKDPLQGTEICKSMESFEGNESPSYVACVPCQKGIRNIKKGSVNLILTDPPHSDRIPYLELSELWNGILGTRVGLNRKL